MRVSRFVQTLRKIIKRKAIIKDLKHGQLTQQSKLTFQMMGGYNSRGHSEIYNPL